MNWWPILIIGAALLLIPRRKPVQLKPGVKIDKLSPVMTPAIVTWERIAAEHDFPAVITSGTEGTHSEGSFHYPENAPDDRGRALDFRRPDRDQGFNDPERARRVAEELAANLGPEYDVVLEPTHIHVEHDPEVA